MISGLPLLYSFRRCPYAIRARLAIANADIIVELREVILRNKPDHLLKLSPKGTVPVLLLNNGIILEESLDIMLWAFKQKKISDGFLNKECFQLILQNDNEFKYFLDRYKYSDRYPEHPVLYYREKAEIFLKKLEQKLSKHTFLCGNNMSIADMAIFPFIRQFASVDLHWFHNSPYINLNQWLNNHLQSALFISVMDKYPAWQAKMKK